MAVGEVVKVRTGPTFVRRSAVVVAAALAAVVVWLLATQVLGEGLRAPGFNDGQPSQPVGLGMVVAVSLLAGAAGWGLLALLERLLAARAWRVWTGVAGAVLLLSLGGPLSGTGTTGTSRMILVLLHLVVGAVLIAGLPRTVAGRERRARRETSA